ncbi:hypothetical protein CU097_003149 [Rhizopus azygosporus]|uniref:Intersectin-1 n=1 Tax=Rhizopus azygosporus TaxID=86630 RepID=A0A367JL98_RHIAZ|nr:hypothetical protein CU097_003149 [Rhizopus azygosporus]
MSSLHSRESDVERSVDDLKKHITTLDREIALKRQDNIAIGRSSSGRSGPAFSHSQWWSRYQINMRQLEDLLDQRQALLKEINYLTGNSLKRLEEELYIETERLNTAKLKAARLKLSTTQDISRGSYDTIGLTESERIRAKAQAMVAARLRKDSTLSEDSLQTEEENAKKRLAIIKDLTDEVKKKRDVAEDLLRRDLSVIDHDLDIASKDLRERQMFEQGLYIDGEVARFIEQLGKLHVSDRSRIPPLPLNDHSRHSLNDYSLPPPIPTSQRPGTPRSEADIKAEAFRRIQARKAMFTKGTPSPTPANACKNTSDEISDEIKASQERMKQAEAEARAHLEAMREKRNKLRQEAAKAEEQRKKAAAEAAAAAEAEMLAEKKRKQEEERQRLEKIRREQEELREKQEQERLAELERIRKQQEELERLREEERKKKEEEERVAEEIRQRKARKAAEEAAREKRLRREEIERREKEIEAARQEELNRRKKWEEAERQKRIEEEQEAERLRKLREEEEARIKEERYKEQEIELQRKKEIEEKLQKQREQKEEQQEANLLAVPEVISKVSSPITTAGTSGYGIDIEDEVNFNISNIVYRVKTLYEYHGIREDDLSFSASEIIKAHPSKDKASDWWYGTSLSTNQVGFFPRTYVEVIEEAFRVRTLYEYVKTRPGDLGFSENEVIVVQPFQDETSGWWYGTNEETNESGYFPKSYVEVIDSAKTLPSISINATTPPMSIPLVQTPTSIHNPHGLDTSGGAFLNVNDRDVHRGLSAPNTPIMKKTSLEVNKAELTKRRRAASNVSTMSNSRISTPTIVLPRPDNISENLELQTWSSTMDELELKAIPSEERQRQEAIFELIATERTYLNDLQLIVNVFYTDSGKYLTQDERDVIFSNIDDLLLCNTSLLSDMETRQREQGNVVDKIGDIFLKHAESLKCYSTFCRNQSYATKFLQKKREEDQWFEVFLKTAQTRPECRSLDFSHFLLEPVQRITRYPLLLRQILNSTPKKHPDHALVRSALSVAQRILEDVNEETRRFENNQKMDELARIIDMEGTGRLNIPGREFIMDGILFKAKSGRKLHGFLFNDILILAEPLKALNERGYLYILYREPMPLERVTVRQQHSISLKPSFSASNSEDLSFQIVNNNHVIAIKASSATQKRQWLYQLQHYCALRQYNP